MVFAPMTEQLIIPISTIIPKVNTAGSSFLNDVKKMWPNFGITLGGTLVIEGIIMAIFLLYRV